MREKLVGNIFNFCAVVLLVLLISAPIYFANNFAKIAGIKSESPYLIISQVENFPGMTFTQSQNDYSLSFTKQAVKQAYMSILIINNPTDKTKTYTIKTSNPRDTVFFGSDLNNQKTTISTPAGVSVPISIISTGETNTGTILFSINSN